MKQTTILIADDDPVTLESIDACLTAEGYRTVLAKNGKEALDQWQKKHPNLCCLDIMMPEVNGYDVCSQIRAKDSKIPILFLSAKSEEIDVVVGFKLGADDFIRKPFGKHELLARINTALRHAQPGSNITQSPFTMNDITIYPLELRAERNGINIELLPREVSILELLYEQAGKVVDRDTILDRCWGMEYYPESRTLDQHISKLRKHIESDPANPSIVETIRGVGYRFRPRNKLMGQQKSDRDCK